MQANTRKFDYIIVGLSIASILGAIGQFITYGLSTDILGIVEVAMFSALAIGAAFVFDRYPLAGLLVTAIAIVGYGLVSVARILAFLQIDVVDPFKTRNIAAMIVRSTVVWFFLAAYLLKQFMIRGRRILAV